MEQMINWPSKRLDQPDIPVDRAYKQGYNKAIDDCIAAEKASEHEVDEKKILNLITSYEGYDYWKHEELANIISTAIKEGNVWK